MRRPRLESLLALMGASTGLTLPIIAERTWAIAPVSYDAAALGAVAGLGFALILHAAHRYPPRRERLIARHPWILQLVLWTTLAFAISMILSLAEGWSLDDEGLWVSSFAGALAGALTFPFGWWLLRRAERARRARQGSLVAGADERSLWSVAAVTLAVECAIALPAWRYLTEHHISTWPPAWIGHVAIGCAVGIGLLVAAFDLVALRRAMGWGQRCDELEPLDPLADDAAVGPEIDLGLGLDVHGRVEIESHYRGLTRRIPAVIGDPLQAVTALQAAWARSVISGLVLLGIGLYALSSA